MLDPFYPKSPRQIISYVSAHDNYSLWDKLLITCMDDPDFEKEPDKDVLQINKFIAGIVFTCLGQPFMQAGEEFARTKLGAGDSYNLSPKLNRLDYERKDAMEDLVNYYKGLIAFRKKYPAYGEDMEALQQAARDLAARLETVPGTANVSDGLEDAVSALHVNIDRNAAMRKGMTVAQIYMQVAAALVESTDGADMTLDGMDVGVTIESAEDSRMTREKLLDLEITVSSGSSDMSAMMGGGAGGDMASMMGGGASGMSGMMGSTTTTPTTSAPKSFKLSEVATVEETVSLNSIAHSEQRRYVTVSAGIAEGYNVTLVSSAVQDAVADVELPDGVKLSFSGENEMIMEAMKQLLLMLLLGVVLVYFIMVAQFQSLKSPFIVMFTIPLAFTGGFLALLLFGIEVSVISLIGFVMLVGIIVNNGIVLVDYINQLRLEGMERQEAIVEAGITRLRPILMTSITTILGLVVMAFTKNVGTSLMQPVALVSIGGLSYATLMTLLVVPCMYDMVAQKDLRKVDESDLEILDI